MKKILLVALLASLSNISHAICDSKTTQTAPNSRYQLLSNNSEVKDLKTGLIWQRCSVGQIWNGTSCTSTATKHTWVNALQVAQSMGSGWRVPNIKELKSLVEYACSNPSINQAIFSNTMSERYWSSSTSAYANEASWMVHFGVGYDNANDKNNQYYVRLVRYAE